MKRSLNIAYTRGFYDESKAEDLVRKGARIESVPLKRLEKAAEMKKRF